MVEQGTKHVYLNVYLKDFIISGKIRTTIFIKALNAYNEDSPVRMNIHVMGHGDWKTGEITSFKWKRGHLFIETKNCIYRLVGKERVKKVKNISVMVPDEKQALTSMKKEDMERLAEYVARGESLRAYVVRRDGGFSVTSSIVKVFPIRRRFVTESGSIYSW